MAGTWEETWLWKTLSRRTSGAAKVVNAALLLSMPKIEQVLRSGGTAPLSFTLHDDGHSFRVAERMVEIVTPALARKLSTYELALLLLSAYLHDIGMTPERQTVGRHHHFLLTGAAEDLSGAEREAFLRWLDAEGQGAVVPLDARGPASEVQPLAEELIAYYARHKHNDWSKAWIDANLTNADLGGYVNWRADLVTLCQSHHWGYRELKSADFDPRLAGSPAQVIHLRFLAAVLRMADILEFDPERTPAVVFRHRQVSEKSAIYWWKDHQITLNIGKDQQIAIFASPPTAYIHRAIDTMVNDIEEELRLCRRLDDETHFEKYPGPGKDLPHRWTLLPYIHRHVIPQGYEYIDGAFRPDTQKLLELFSGAALYGNELIAVRELLQNAFDAVRQQIALERLAENNPADPKWERELGERHRVTLKLDMSGTAPRLTCTDTGIGMTKALIRDRLLVSGSARRPDILGLERRAKAAGFSLSLSGQFGIGVLSYFMLADQITIQTRRSQQSEDAEESGWTFRTNGVGSFGELRSERELRRGTTVELRLRVPAEKRSWVRDIRRYVREVLQRVPCYFDFESDEADVQPLHFRPGWTEASTGVMRAGGAAGTFSDHEFDGELPDGIGRYLLQLGYLDMPGGVSLASLRVEADGDTIRLSRLQGDEFCYLLHADTTTYSWRGFQVGLGSYRVPSVPVHVRMDLCSSETGRVSLNRQTFQFNDKVQSRLDEFIQREIKTVLSAFVRDHSGSLYAALNYRVAELTIPRNEGVHWIVPGASEGAGEAEWRRLEFPAISFLNETLSPMSRDVLQWHGRPVTEILPLPSQTPHGRTDIHAQLLPWDIFSFPPDRIVAGCRSRPSLAALWEQPSAPMEKPGRVMARFAPAWRDLCGAWFFGTNHIVWNAEHPLVEQMTKQAWEATSRQRHPNLADLAFAAERNAAPASALVLRLFAEERRDDWEDVRRRDPARFSRVLRRAFGRDDWKLCFWRQSVSTSRLDVLTPDSWISYEDPADIADHLPAPDVEWRLSLNAPITT